MRNRACQRTKAILLRFEKNRRNADCHNEPQSAQSCPFYERDRPCAGSADDAFSSCPVPVAVAVPVHVPALVRTLVRVRVPHPESDINMREHTSEMSE